MDSLTIGEISITWLEGGYTQLDGGAMFGVVPKPLWEKKYPCNERNQIKLKSDPLLIQLNGKNLLVDTGLGNGKFTDKQKRNYGIDYESEVEKSLQKIGLTCGDIDFILMTHLHFDHACGLTKWENDSLVPTFKNASILTSRIEWEEALNPNIRSRNTYWEANVSCIQDLVKPFENELEVIPGVKMIHTGGHSDGHAIIVLESNGEKAIHMADIMPTHAHQNVLWVLAFDDYPMDSIAAKQKWMEEGYKNKAWYIFYHDAYYRAIKWDESGKEVLDSVKVTT